jgi:outer membrane protein assembly factor BamB
MSRPVDIDIGTFRLSRRLVLVAVLVAALACVASAACSDGGYGRGTSSSPGPGSSATRVASPAFDPPRSFDTSNRLGLGSVPSGYLYAGRDGVYAVHARDTTRTATTSPAKAEVRDPVTARLVRTFSFDAIPNKYEQVRFVELDGQMQLFVAYRFHKEGTGTAADQQFLRVRRYSFGDGAVRWSVDVSLPSVAALGNVFVTGVTDQHVVVSARERGTPGAEISRNSVAVVLDTATGAQRWIRERFIPYAVHGDVIVGTTPKPDRSEEQNRVEALHARTGAEVWRFGGFNIDRGDEFGYPVGDQLVQVNTRRPGDGLYSQVFTAHLLEIATGRTVITLEHDHGFACVHDKARLIVCHVESSQNPTIAAYDAASFKQLWVLDAGTPGRKVPLLLVAYHGLVYVGLDGTSVVRPTRAGTLDGQTGADANPDLGFVPEQVGPGYAVGHKDGALTLYRATS